MKNRYTTYFQTTLYLFFLFTGSAVAQQADFSYTASPASLCTPVTIILQNKSTGTPVAYTWDFGDGRTSHAMHPQVTYQTPGPHTIKLSVQYRDRVSEYFKTFTAGATPAVSFTVDKARDCKPYQAVFTDQTPDGFLRVWDFGDGTAPVSTNNNSVSHQYTKAGTFDVSVTVTNSSGCTANLTKPAMIQVSIPEISISEPIKGCVPVDASFTINTTNVMNDPVVNYLWNFADGTSLATTTSSVTHRYTNTGTYHIGVTVSTQQGCTVSQTFNRQVMAGNPPSDVSFTASPSSVCVGEEVRLLANARFATTYSWDFDDGTTQEGSANDIRHAFKRNGTRTVQMKAGNNGCYTPATPVAVNVTGPVAAFSLVRNCTNKNTFEFTNTSTGTTANTTYEWDFGDNSPLVRTPDATHQYTIPGKYTVRLTIRETGGNCSSSDFKDIQYFVPDFSAGVSTICRGTTVNYEVLNVPLGLVAGYIWHFGDNTSIQTTQQFVKKTWQTKGTFDDVLEIRYNDPAYCTEFVRRNQHIKVTAPQANFALSSAACEGQPVTYNNTSVNTPNVPFTTWRWDLGNGIISTAQTPVPVKYPASGNYTVKLQVTDVYNCVDSVSYPVTINPAPFLHINTPKTKICEGERITLQALSDARVEWLTGGNISCGYCNNPDIWPIANTRYLAQATNANGCTIKDSVDIQVVPKVNLTLSKDTIACYGSSVKLQAGGATHYSWTPVDYLTNNTIANPLSTPEMDITYTVRGTNDPACPMSDPLQVKVSVKQLPTVYAGRDQTVTVGTVVKLAATGSADVVKWEWTPKDYLDCPTCQAVTAAVRKPTTYSITATNADGCTASDLLDVDLVCNTDVVFIPNSFSPNGDGQNDIFYPRGKGIHFIKSFRIFNRWGQEVFRREKFNVDDSAAGWNGLFNGKPQPADVYIWFLEAWCDTNEFFQLKGNVTLLR